MSNNPFPVTWYRARITKVVDGDTVDAVIDCGFKATRTERLRLLGVDTCELNSKIEAERILALSAKDFVYNWVNSNSEWPLLIRTYKTDSFGRYLADIKKGEISLSEELLKNGLAKKMKG